MSPAQVFSHARDQLQIAMRVCSGHQPAFYGLCACNLVLPCPVKVGWGRHALYWLRCMVRADDQLAALAGPTQVIGREQ